MAIHLQFKSTKKGKKSTKNRRAMGMKTRINENETQNQVSNIKTDMSERCVT